MSAKNVPASVHAKLLEISRTTKRPLQELLLYYAIERFLYRLSVSKHGDRFVLKGGLLLRLWDAPLSRPTKDIDFLCYASNDLDLMVAMAREVCAIDDPKDGLHFDPASVIGQRIKEDADYEGVRLRFIGKLGNARLSMQIDIGFGDTVVPTPSRLEYPTLLAHAAPTLRAYPPETVIAEKFEAMVMLGTLNSRMKDFYDIWLLARTHDFGAAILSRAIETTFAHRKRDIEVDPVALTSEFFDSDHTKKQWAAFIKNAKLEHSPKTLSEVVEVIRIFLLPVVSQLNGGGTLAGRWAAPGPWSA